MTREVRDGWVRNWLQGLLTLAAMQVCVELMSLVMGYPPLWGWAEAHPKVSLPCGLGVMLVVVFCAFSFASGWWDLSRFYRTQRARPANTKTGSAVFRYVLGYNNLVRLGSDAEGIYISSWVRLFHPPLFIPWADIEVGPSKRILFLKRRKFLLGRVPRVPFQVDGRTADRLLLPRESTEAGSVAERGYLSRG